MDRVLNMIARFLFEVLLLLQIVFVATVGAALFLAGMGLLPTALVQSVVDTILWHNRGRQVAICAGMILFLSSFLVARLAMGFRRRGQFASIQNPAGGIRISQGAIEDVVKGVGKRLSKSVERLRPTVHTRGHRVRVQCDLWARQTRSVAQLAHEVQDAVRQELVLIFGDRLHFDVSVVVREVDGTPSHTDPV